jgi:hypothetical protein
MKLERGQIKERRILVGKSLIKRPLEISRKWDDNITLNFAETIMLTGDV